MRLRDLARNARLYSDTLVRLRPTQLVFRLRRAIYRPRHEFCGSVLPAAVKVADWIPGVRHEATWDGAETFRFLNRAERLSWPQGWNDVRLPLLWRYNLHYFRDLLARDAEGRREAHRALLDQWIADNPPAGGVGWDPYPVSLRIRSWIRWWIEVESPCDRWVASLAEQARWLRCNLEYHLLGNHLLENAFALFAAGCWFDGEEAREFRAQGVELITEQLNEQVLRDGGHFERSPMYQALLLEALLDSINLGRVYGVELPSDWRRIADCMRGWFRKVLHPDSEIPLLNDAALGISARPLDLLSYADRVLGQSSRDEYAAVVDLPDSGYVVVTRGCWHAILDVGSLGPAYLAGHGHADTLSFEMSICGRRFLVDPGTSTYENGPQRWYERSTRAHNTVSIDLMDSSNVWHAFRTGRQAAVVSRQVTVDQGSVQVCAAHDGYAGLRGRPVHQRTWIADAQVFEILDQVLGSGRHRVDVNFLLAPTWEVAEQIDERSLMLAHADGVRVRFRLEGPVALTVQCGQYHPEFGVALPTIALCCAAEVELPVGWKIVLEVVESPGRSDRPVNALDDSHEKRSEPTSGEAGGHVESAKALAVAAT